MRIALVAGAVAVVVLVAVVVVGLRLTGDDEPEWSESRNRRLRASAWPRTRPRRLRRCDHAGGAASGGGLRGRAEIESDLLAELEALPRPSADDAEIERTLAVVADSHRDDLAVLARLRRSFDRRFFERRVNETVPVLADLRSRFTALGATGCVSFYDPDSYAVG